MDITILKSDTQETKVILNGELDTAAVDKLKDELQSVMDNPDKQVTVDFTDLEYISSAGMRVLLLLNKTVQGKGGKMTIIGMSEDIRQIFQMTGFDQMIEIKD